MKDEDRCRLSGLIDLACTLGADGAKVIQTAEISIEDDLAKPCTGSRCENYGLAASCPPYVSGPSGFREFIKDCELAVVFRIEVPSESLFSGERRNVFRLLHEVAAGLEQYAVKIGYRDAKAFAGGSCKQIFCPDLQHCPVVHEGASCRYPDHARPSMSGFGINVTKLMQAAGWTMNLAVPEGTSVNTSMATVCGLVLLG